MGDFPSESADYRTSHCLLLLSLMLGLLTLSLLRAFIEVVKELGPGPGIRRVPSYTLYLLRCVGVCHLKL